MLVYEKLKFDFYMQRSGWPFISKSYISSALDVGLGTKDLADFNIGVQVIDNHIGNFNLMYSIFNL